MCLVSGGSSSGVLSGGFPGCFPESLPWVLSLRAVVIRHTLHVMSSVGRAHPGCP